MVKKILWCGGPLVLVAMITVITITRLTPPSQKVVLNHPPVKTAPTQPEPVRNKVVIATPPEEPVDFAPSLRGTRQDGYFSVDREGNLKVTRGTRDLFDYYLAAFGERTLREIITRIERQARSSLPDNAAGQAVDLLHDYVAYRKAAQSYLQQDISTEQQANRTATLEATFRKLVAMRRHYFTPEDADAFFGVEEQYGRYALARIKINANPDLSEQARQHRLKLIDENAPAEIIRTKRQTTGQAEMAERVAQLREQGAGDDAILRARMDYISEDDARRMAKIDARNTAWELRYSQYAKNRRQILAAPGLTGADRQSSVVALRDQYFSGAGYQRAAVRDRAKVRKLARDKP